MQVLFMNIVLLTSTELFHSATAPADSPALFVKLLSRMVSCVLSLP